MQCNEFIALAQIQTPTSGEFWAALAMLMFFASGVSMYWQVMANRRKATESHEPARRILPTPFPVSKADEPVLASQLNHFSKDVEREFRRIEKDMETRRGEIAEKFTSLEQKLDLQGRDFHQAMQSLAKELHRAVGVLEGKTNAKWKPHD